MRQTGLEEETKIMEDRSCGGPVVLQRSCSGPLIDNIAGPDRRIGKGVLSE